MRAQMQANSAFDTFPSSVGLMRWAESAQRPHISVTALALVGLDLLPSIPNRELDSTYLLYRRSVILRFRKNEKKKNLKFLLAQPRTQKFGRCLA